MKNIISVLSLVLSSIIFSQSKAKYFTVYNDEIIYTGNDRLNLYTDIIDSIKILKGEESSDYFENVGGVILVYLKNKIDKQIITKEELNSSFNQPVDRAVYINGEKLFKDL